MKFKFTASDREWHQTVVNAFENFLKMKIKPIIVYDRRHFSGYVYKDSTKPTAVWAECIKEYGIIWLNPHLSTEPKVETLNTLYHECLHIKYPKMHENKIRKLADKMIPVRPLEPKKKHFDIVHKK